MSFLQAIRVDVMERALVALRASGRGLRARHLDVGERGEQAALFFLKRQGFVIVARQWRSAKEPGDVDLIAYENNTLCFIEVKTRGAGNIASAEAAVDADKRRTIRRLARLYIKNVDPPAESVRFDVVSVYAIDGRLDVLHFRAAFGWRE